MRISPINFYSCANKPSFRANYEKSNNVAILGSSKDSKAIEKELEMCSQITKGIVLSGKNVLSGCGSRGIMGRAYYGALQYSKTKDRKPEQNIVFLKQPLWGDEDLENCVVFGTCKTEAERIGKFYETADSFVIFPGGPATIQEASTLISNAHYGKSKKKIVLVGSEYFKGLDEQYKTMKKAGLISKDLSELYTITDDVDEVLNIINNR